MKPRTLMTRFVAHAQKVGAQLAAAQAACPHEQVAHFDGHIGSTVGHPRRICESCGFEERGSWWSSVSWFRKDSEAPNDNGVLGKASVSRLVDWAEFASLRPPQAIDPVPFK